VDGDGDVVSTSGVTADSGMAAIDFFCFCRSGNGVIVQFVKRPLGIDGYCCLVPEYVVWFFNVVLFASVVR